MLRSGHRSASVRGEWNMWVRAVGRAAQVQSSERPWRDRRTFVSEPMDTGRANKLTYEDLNWKAVVGEQLLWLNLDAKGRSGLQSESL